MKAELVNIPLRLPESQTPRSKGIHASGVIRCIASEQGILKPEFVEDLSLVDLNGEAWWENLGSANQLRIGIGIAWEQWYVKTLQEVADHPGEMCLDSIYMTPDGESVDFLYSLGLAMHEFKATYKSTKTVGNLTTQWLWLAQTKAYCKAAGTAVCFIHVLFLCGDYKYPITPQLRVWRVEYTPEELDDNWDILTGYVKHRQLMEREEDHGLEGGV